jgi:hypothetical protein
MGKSRVREYFDTLSGTPIRFSPYAILKTGLISSQTILNVEDYMLICSPYQISMRNAILLLILSAEETRFFQHYRDQYCALSLTFQKPGTHHPEIFDVKGRIERIGPVKDRQNLCMIDISFADYPPKLVELLGDFILAHNSLRSYYETYRGKEIVMNEHMARMLRFNNYMECFFGPHKFRARLEAISVNRVIFDIPADAPDVLEGNSFSCKLYFQLYQFVVHGIIEEIEGYRAGALRVYASIGFAPELIEIMDDYFYRLTHAVANGIPQSLRS